MSDFLRLHGLQPARPDSSIYRISQGRILECVAISSSGDLPDPQIEPVFPALAGRLFTTELPGKPLPTM